MLTVAKVLVVSGDNDLESIYYLIFLLYYWKLKLMIKKKELNSSLENKQYLKTKLTNIMRSDRAL